MKKYYALLVLLLLLPVSVYSQPTYVYNTKYVIYWRKDTPNGNVVYYPHSLYQDVLSSWSFEDFSAVYNYDRLGRYDLPPTGSLGSVTGKLNKGSSFADLNSYFYGAGSTFGQHTRGMTWACWVLRSTTPGANAAAISDGIATNNVWQARVTAACLANGYIRDGAINVVNVSAGGSSICDNTWQLLVMSWNENHDKNLRIRVPTANISLVSGTPGTSEMLYNNTTNIRFGLGNSTSYPWGVTAQTALIDECTIWNVALSAQELYELHRKFYPYF